MTLIYNDIPYEVTAESIYCDFGIRVSTIEEACTIINDLADMETYTFNSTDYENMTIKKRMIVLDENGITVRIVMKQKRGVIDNV